MDDTRDIAIEGRTLGQEARRRLDGINGSIDGLRDDVGDLRTEMAGFKGMLRVYGRVGAALLALVTSVVSGVCVWAVATHSATPRSEPKQHPAALASPRR